MNHNKWRVTLFLGLIVITFLSISTANSCQQLLGTWTGIWDDLEQVQNADIHFLTLQDKVFSGFYTLENGQQGVLSGSCSVETEYSGYLVFARTPPLYNPCYGRLNKSHLAIWCLNPNQSGTFKKV